MSESAPRRLLRAESVLAGRQRDITVVLEDARDTHNVSAVLRTCEALGIQDVHLVVENHESAEINRDVTKGAHRWLTLHRHYGNAQAMAALRQAGYRIYAAMLGDQTKPLTEIPCHERAAFVFGNEKTGLAELWATEADACFAIATNGFSGSLNLSVAVALTLYDRLMGTQRTTLPAGNLPEQEKHLLRAAWYERLAHGSDALHQEYKSWLNDPPQSESVHPVDVHREPRS